jgi:hypothetical protein
MVIGASYLTGIIYCQTRKENPSQTLSDFRHHSYVVRPPANLALTVLAQNPYNGGLFLALEE